MFDLWCIMSCWSENNHQLLDTRKHKVVHTFASLYELSHFKEKFSSLLSSRRLCVYFSSNGTSMYKIHNLYKPKEVIGKRIHFMEILFTFNILVHVIQKRRKYWKSVNKNNASSQHFGFSSILVLWLSCTRFCFLDGDEGVL